MSLIQSISRYVAQLTAHPGHEATRAQRFVRYAIDLSRHCAKQLVRDRAPQMAAALTYRTIFSLVPVLVMSMLLFRAFVKLQDAQEILQTRVYAYMGIDDLALPGEVGSGSTGAGGAAAAAAPSTQASSASGAAGARGREASSGRPRGALEGASPRRRQRASPELRESIDDQIKGLTENAYTLDLKSIGGIGLAVLIWAALAMLITVEQCFNLICESPRGRPWHLRVMIYWAVITLGPVLFLVSVYLAGTIVSKMAAIGWLGALVRGLSSFTALAASWLLLCLLYTLMPTIKVRIKYALVGSVVAALLWEIGKWGFKLYVTKAVPYNALYGTLGLIPLFLFWVYVTWLIVLFGMELTYTLQTLHGRRLAEQQERRAGLLSAGDPRWVLPIMTQIGRAFVEGKTTTVGDISEAVDLPSASVADITHRLEKAGLVHEVAREDIKGDCGLTLAMPADQIPLATLLDFIQALSFCAKKPTKGEAGWAYLSKLHDAERKAAAGETLADLVGK